MVPAYVAWEACIFVNSILKVDISVDWEASALWLFVDEFPLQLLVEGVWDKLDTSWWSLSPIILSFDVFCRVPECEALHEEHQLYQPWTVEGMILYAVRLVRPRPSSDLLDDLIALAGGEEPRWKFSTDHSFWRLGWTVSGDSLGHFSCGGGVFCLRNPLWKDKSSVTYWVCWYLRTSSFKSIC